VTKKEFFNSIVNGNTDVIQLFLDLLDDSESDYCIIGGLAVNAYAEPVVSLDIDIVVIVSKLEELCARVRSRGMSIRTFPNSINLSLEGSDLRIQLQTDPRYQSFISRSKHRNVLGYNMAVASLTDVLQGKIWAYLDQSRRSSKRQKDLADIMRLVETHQELKENLPPDIINKFS
jgi:hypothetical protein